MNKENLKAWGFSLLIILGGICAILSGHEAMQLFMDWRYGTAEDTIAEVFSLPKNIEDAPTAEGEISLPKDPEAKPGQVARFDENANLKWVDMEDVSTLVDTIDFSTKYQEGFNDALTCMALLNLELRLMNERKTFGEMNEICRERWDVSKEGE